MTDEDKWKAVANNDETSDGLFFYAVKSTGIYCRPSCKSKLTNRENIDFFDSAQQAEEAGFRPCKRCRPDLINYQPAKEIAEKAKHLIDEAFREKLELNAKFNSLGITQHRMVEIFKAEYNVSTFEYINILRLKEAKKLLEETDEEITSIAYSIGFASLSAFYRFFKINTGQSPSAYRKLKKGKSHRN